MLVAEHGGPTMLTRIGLMRALHRGKDVGPLEQGEIGPDLFRAACDMGLEGLVSKHRDRLVSGRQVEALDQGEEPEASRDGASDGVSVASKSALGDSRN